MSQRKVLVIGATGNQGRAVVKALIERNHQVYAMVRNPEKASAKALETLGVALVQGDLNAPDTIEAAMSGVDTVFAMTTMAAGLDVEIQHGKAIADAVKSSGHIEHFVFSSVSDADRKTGIPHFESKYEIEQYIQTLDIPWTITAPAYFYDNVLFPWNLSDLKRGIFRQAMPGNRTLQQISARDIGRFNAWALDQREAFLHRRINIAGDDLTAADMANILSEAIGHPITYQEQSIDDMRQQSEDMALMYTWFDEVGYTADIDSLRTSYSEVDWQTFAQWAKAQDWKALLAS